VKSVNYLGSTYWYKYIVTALAGLCAGLLPMGHEGIGISSMLLLEVIALSGALPVALALCGTDLPR